MTLSDQTTAASAPQVRPGATLRRLYFVRFGFAVVWALLLFLTGATPGPVLSVLVIIYPLFDAAAVLYQVRSADRAPATRVPELINVAVSVAVAVALGVASAVSAPAVLGVWGVWAVASGIPQLITAIRRRRTGGQVPQILSGAISVVAGAGFLAQAFGGAAAVTGIGGYAIVGAIFFLISAIRLSLVLRRS